MSMKLLLGVKSLPRYNLGIFVMDVRIETIEIIVEGGGGFRERRIRGRSSSADLRA